MPQRVLTILKAAAIAGATWFVFAPAFYGGWLWDDPAEITTNLALRNWHGLWQIWFSPSTPDYYPLKTTVQWVQWHLWGDDLLGYHLTNVGLHLLSALLLWHLLGRLGVKRAWLGGLLFAVHPVVVESVAWIAELKNVLSLPLLLGAMIFYLRWDEEKKPGSGKKGTAEAAYWFAVILFLAAMLCKSSVVMFPVVLLLYAWWRRGRAARRDVIAALPFFLISLALGVVTMWFQKHHAIDTLVIRQGGFFSRLAVAGTAIVFYLGKFLAPVNLLPIYPRWNVIPPSLWQFWPWAVAIAGVLLWFGRGRGATARQARLHTEATRPWVFGIGFFLINLLPVLGFVPMSFLRISWVADHFVYLPMIGLVGLAAAGFGRLRPAYWVAGAALIAALAVQSRFHAGHFASEQTMWEYTLQRNPDAWLAHNNLSNLLLDEGRVVEAEAELRAAIRLKPDFAEAHNNLGNLLNETGQVDAAKAEFDEAIRLKPNYAEAYNGVANNLLHRGQAEQALAVYDMALRLKPDYPDCHDNRGAALDALGRYREAIAEYEFVIKSNPGFAMAHYNLGFTLGEVHRTAESISQYKEALRFNPRMIAAYNNLGNAYADARRFGEAIVLYEKALTIDPNHFEVHLNLANALVNLGRATEAIPHYARALALRPDYLLAHRGLAFALQAVGRDEEAKAEFRKAGIK